MKQIWILMLLTWSFRASAQKYNLDIRPITIEKEEVNAIVAVVDPSSSWMRDAWDDWMKEQHGIDFDKRQLLFFSKKTMRAEDVSFKAISPKSVSLYSTTEKLKNGGNEFIVYGKYANGDYFKSMEDNSALYNLRTVVSMFMKASLPKYYKEQIQDTNESIEDLTEENDKLRKRLEEYEDKIESLKKEIQENEENLATLKSTQKEEQEIKQKINKKLYK